MYKYLNIELELRHLFEALKNTMLCISYFKQATLRARAIKAIKNLVKIDPENLLDTLVQQIIQLRLRDISSSTRESTIDLISQYVSKFVNKN